MRLHARTHHIHQLQWYSRLHNSEIVRFNGEWCLYIPNYIILILQITSFAYRPHVYTPTPTHTCTYMPTCTPIYTRLCAHTHAYMPTRTCLCAHTQTHAHTPHTSTPVVLLFCTKFIRYHILQTRSFAYRTLCCHCLFYIHSYRHNDLYLLLHLYIYCTIIISYIIMFMLLFSFIYSSRLYNS